MLRLFLGLSSQLLQLYCHSVITVLIEFNTHITVIILVTLVLAIVVVMVAVATMSVLTISIATILFLLLHYDDYYYY